VGQISSYQLQDNQCQTEGAANDFVSSEEYARLQATTQAHSKPQEDRQSSSKRDLSSSFHDYVGSARTALDSERSKQRMSEPTCIHECSLRALNNSGPVA
jgi:hypothetical protein